MRITSVVEIHSRQASEKKKGPRRITRTRACKFSKEQSAASNLLWHEQAKPVEGQSSINCTANRSVMKSEKKAERSQSRITGKSRRASTETGDKFTHVDHFFHRRPPDHGKTLQRKNNFCHKCYRQVIVRQQEFLTIVLPRECKRINVTSRLALTILKSLMRAAFRLTASRHDLTKSIPIVLATSRFEQSPYDAPFMMVTKK